MQQNNGSPPALTIRQARSSDAPEIIGVVDSVYGYGVDRDSRRWETWRQVVADRSGHWWVLSEDGRMVGVCKAGRRRLRFGAAAVSWAEVSELCILPERQHGGLGSLLLDYVLERMREAGVAFSELTARRLDLVEFYRRRGYARCPTRDVELHTEDSPAPPAETAQQIRPFDPDRDLAECAELYNDFSRRFMGSLIWEPPQGAWPHRYRLVCTERGRLAAYFYACDAFGQVAYRDGREDAFRALLRHVAGQARQDGKERLVVKVPWSGGMTDVLERSGVGFTLRESWPRTMLNMVRFISLEALFTQLLPELNRRLGRLAKPLTGVVVEIATEADAARVEVRNGQMGIADSRQPGVRLELTQVDLLAAVLGVFSFWDVCAGRDVPDEVRGLLGDVFPRGPFTGGSEIWGPDSYDLTAHPLVEPGGSARTD